MVELDADPPPTSEVASSLAALATALERPSGREDAVSVLARAIELARASGADRLVLSMEPTLPSVVEAADAVGFVRTRELFQLRRALPMDEPWDLVVRPFRPGIDDQAWLAVNARAFAWHPEQGHLTADDFARKQAEPWFDPEGFLVHEIEGRLAGFCWTKIHRDTRPVLGEIFVIGVDPDFHGKGLGRPLTLAGLDWLSRQGISEAMLYVEADNHPARRLYDSLGFVEHHAKVWYEIVLRASRP